MIRPARGISVVPQAADQALGDVSERSPAAVPFHASRREPRSAAELTFALFGLAASGKFFVELCSTINVSRSGCCLRLRTRPQSDSAIALRAVPGGASLPQGTSQLLLQLAWLRPDAEGWLVGAFALGEADLHSLAFPSSAP